jgi:hypothetical protein
MLSEESSSPTHRISQESLEAEEIEELESADD